MPGTRYSGVAVKFLVTWGYNPEAINLLEKVATTLSVRASEQQVSAELHSSAG